MRFVFLALLAAAPAAAGSGVDSPPVFANSQDMICGSEPQTHQCSQAEFTKQYNTFREQWRFIPKPVRDVCRAAKTLPKADWCIMNAGLQWLNLHPHDPRHACWMPGTSCSTPTKR